MFDQISFHLVFLFNRPSIKALTILLVLMLFGMLNASGVFDYRLLTDSDRVAAAMRYTLESMQLIKSVVAVIGMLTASLSYLRPNSRYVVYLIENAKTKRETGLAKILAVLIAISMVYLISAATFVGIGCLFTTHFDMNVPVWIKLVDSYRFIVWLTLVQCVATQVIPSLFSVGIGMGMLWLFFSVSIVDWQPIAKEIIACLTPIVPLNSSSEITLLLVVQIATVLTLLTIGNVVVFVHKDAF